MSHEQMKGVFKGLNELLQLPENDWEDELSSEQYFSVLMAYNDQIKGNRRDKNKQGLTGKVYPLSTAEKTVLELAYKSGKFGTFDENDIVKSLSAICDKDVTEILSQFSSRKEIIENLHNLAVKKITSNVNAKSHPFVVYEKACNILDRVTSLISTDNFRMNKSMLENLNNVAGDEDMNVRIENARGVAFEGIYSYIYEAVKVPVYADAYQKIISEAEQG